MLWDRGMHFKGRVCLTKKMKQFSQNAFKVYLILTACFLSMNPNVSLNCAVETFRDCEGGPNPAASLDIWICTCVNIKLLCRFSAKMLKWCDLCVFPFSQALHPAPHLLCLWHTCTFWVPFSTVLCHDQFAALHMTAPCASRDLKDFVCIPSLPRFLSHIQNGHFVFISHFGHWARLCRRFCLSESRLLFGGGIAPNLAKQTPTGSSYVAATPHPHTHIHPLPLYEVRSVW